jgi:hypothetical protein
MGFFNQSRKVVFRKVQLANEVVPMVLIVGKKHLPDPLHLATTRERMIKLFLQYWQGRSQRGSKRSFNGLRFEQLEARTLMVADANLVAYRPVTAYINYALHPVPDAIESDSKQGPGIRVNGDDDNVNGKSDYLDAFTNPGGDNDLVRVDALGTGNTFALAWTGSLAVWTTPTKTAGLSNGGIVAAGQSLWVEYISSTHTVGTLTTMTLSASEETTAGTTATDSIVFHSFRSVVIAIGGNTQDPSQFGDPNLGTFTMAGALYDKGYDVHLFPHSQIRSNGRGAAYNEVVSAVLKRNADNVAFFGYSWGGGATYELSKGLSANTALKPAGYKLQFTAYVDGIRHNTIGAETRLPVGTAYHDNFYQRKDFLLKGNSIGGAHNKNVTQTSWGKSLVHTTIDDSVTLQRVLVGDLVTRVIA